MSRLTRSLVLLLFASASSSDRSAILGSSKLSGGQAPTIPVAGPSSSPADAAPSISGFIAAQFRSLCQGLDPSVDPEALAEKVTSGLPAESISDAQITELMGDRAAYQASMHPAFARLAARVAVSGCTRSPSRRSLRRSARCMHTHNGEAAPLVSDELLRRAEAMAPQLEAALVHERDYDMDYFGLRTLQRSYLHKGNDGTPIERPQHMLMRVALCVHGANLISGEGGAAAASEGESAASAASDADVAAVLKAYDLMSRGLYTHATPTLFNAGAVRPQLCSCFLLTAKADSIDGIFETLKQCARARMHPHAALQCPSRSDTAAVCVLYNRCALISRDAGGIGLSVSHIRASILHPLQRWAIVRLVPMLRVFDATARMSTRVVASVRAPLPSIWSRGMRMWRPSWR